MKKLIVFGEDWGGHPSSTQHLIHHMLPRWDVVWLNSIGLRTPRLSIYDVKRAWKKLSAPNAIVPVTRASASSASDDSDELLPKIINPRIIPLPGSRIARRINRHLLEKQISPFVSADDRPIIWTSLPTAVCSLGLFNESAVVYYCGDDFSSLAGVDHKAVSALEAELAERADCILAASSTLASKFPVEKTVLLPHGVDLDLFQAPRVRPLDLPTHGPIAGFYGSINEWIDIELIVHVAKALPDWHFVLIGPQKVDVSSLLRLDNVHLLGQKAHSDLPAYLQHWDVSLLPFRDNAQIRACNPLKLREYLSVGKPIISTNFPALDGYRDAMSIADRRDFASAIVDCTKYFNSRDYISKRRARVAKESWQARAEELEGMLNKLVENQRPSAVPVNAAAGGLVLPAT